jgi:GT2 family glycosyltransferase
MSSVAHSVCTTGCFKVAAVILSQGDRLPALAEALTSVTRQRDVVIERIVVWNGCAVPKLPDGLVDSDLALERNVGIPEGRNLGAAATDAPILLFLDDDARLLGEASLAAIVRDFETDPQLGVLGMRLVDEQGGTSRRHVPRLGRGRADQPGEVTSFPGGACCIRAAALGEVGGFYGDYFYAMEETDLAWRLLDRGWTIRYAPEHVVFHPRTQPSRHPEAAWRTARNRTWLAYRLLPLPLTPVYLLNWLLITLARRSAPLGEYVRGVGDGWRTRVGPRRPLQWRTVWKLTRLGRPPIV